MNQDDYIKQLEETNRQLQEKLEASEKKHDDYIEKPLYIYMSDDNAQFDHISFTDKCGVNDGDKRIVTKLSYIQNNDKTLDFGTKDFYYQHWKKDDDPTYRWVDEKILDIQVSSIPIKTRARTLKVKWTAEAIQDLNNMHNANMDIGKVLLDELQDEIKNNQIVIKPSKKQIKKYGNKKNVK